MSLLSLHKARPLMYYQAFSSTNRYLFRTSNTIKYRMSSFQFNKFISSSKQCRNSNNDINHNSGKARGGIANFSNFQVTYPPDLMLSYEDVLNLQKSRNFVLKILITLGVYSGKRPRSMFYAKRMYTPVFKHAQDPTFEEVFNFPDTFHSWYIKTVIHVWMAMIRLNGCKADNSAIKKEIFQLFLEDLEDRLMLLEVDSPTFVNKMLNEYVNMSRGFICSMDEGIMGNDKDLASALWRNVFNMECDAQTLCSMVQYIRGQIYYLDKQQESDLNEGRIHFLLPQKAEPMPNNVTI